MEFLSRLESHSAEETESLGEALSTQLVEGDLVVLRGPLGSGKTTLVRGIARGLGCPGASSPSFVLVKEYRGRVSLRHADFFRLDSAAEVEDLGLAELLSPDAVTVVEWPEPLIAMAKEGYLSIALDFGAGPSDRTLDFATEGAAFVLRRGRIADVLKEWS